MSFGMDPEDLRLVMAQGLWVAGAGGHGPIGGIGSIGASG